MAGPGPWVLYDQFKLALGKKLLDLNADSFKVALFTSSSSAINAAVATATYTAFATDGNEVSNANGYTTGGVSVGVGTFTNSGGTEHFDVGDASWTGSAAGIVARAAVLYDNTDASKRAIAYCLLDSTPANVTVPASQVMTIVITDVFTLA